MDAMADDRIRALLKRHWEFAASDQDITHEIYLLEFRGERVARETIYIGEGWTAPEWRAPWRSPWVGEES
jgi:hypothetical protein